MTHPRADEFMDEAGPITTTKLSQTITAFGLALDALTEAEAEAERLREVVEVARRVFHVLWNEIAWTDASECGECSHVSAEDYMKQGKALEELESALAALDRQEQP